ncbi:MAG: HEAT repeat domain-containing protein [Planctomycetes bacterium]|nr:HEAT repeat domain-containing protein [Planctomycetota bacterium]
MSWRYVFSFVACLATGLLLTPLAAADDNQTTELRQQIVALLSNPDREFRAAGLDQIRTGVKGTEHTQFFASQLAKLPPDGQVALLGALADRGDAAARPAVLTLLKSGQNEAVRVAAIAALGKLGDASDLPTLIGLLSAQADAERNAARSSLVRLGGPTVSADIAAATAKAPPSEKVTLLEVLASRRARGQVKTIITASTDDNAQVRMAAMSALGRVGQPEQLGEMIPGVLKAEKGGERDAAERNVAQVCAKIENEDQRGEALIKAVEQAGKEQSDQFLSLIGRVGGKKLIDYVAGIATGPDTARRKLGIDALSKWPNSSVADKLLEITKNATDAAERNQAFQGFVKIGATRDNRNDQQRLERMRQAMDIAKTPEERALVINRTRTSYSVEAVRFVLPYVEKEEFAQIACETLVEISHHREVRDRNKAEFDKVLDKIIATSKDAVVIDRAGRYKRGETWTRPKAE